MSSPNSTPQAPRFTRRMSMLDRALAEAGRAVRVLEGSVQAGRANPAGARKSLTDNAEELTPAEQKHVAGLMRVNHVGEICAQALYRGQALFCRDASIEAVLHQAAAEEVDHLVWCRDRLTELNSRPSLLNPLWYAGSFSLGVLASRAGVGRNLGFMAETERQVEQHLDKHLAELPNADARSRSIVTQMRDDEITHRNTAETHGAETLARPVQLAMRFMSKIMTTTAYRI
ncbi:2-polyprenyl-3-methyl-6-methoxy-1,4-benzoquinone monooxygenase [Pusillimonas sp. MFBS29]|uniref:2-polyprenyl-3-methyl-6-methoxy-1,4-benzoquinone monooxygenase n=1 Tax=Pusillimonas sp. MFBS29 TaxID=2886690 RepID=UPI001D0FCD2E|nr:2-polyprenyl-3-methyl-6-methoxy-1,4-benzoquinone monooxygenase [Pusillimonas sp. MFBS29]MCC2594791.1 2-polyprenyl-3-methyl-6-methoxy-1,4-benzoquinone monooxygenase [Pusillimonas sp. MFBS29]